MDLNFRKTLLAASERMEVGTAGWGGSGIPHRQLVPSPGGVTQTTHPPAADPGVLDEFPEPWLGARQGSQ